MWRKGGGRGCKTRLGKPNQSLSCVESDSGVGAGLEGGGESAE